MSDLTELKENAKRPSVLVKITDSEFQELTAFVKKTFGMNLTKKRMLIEGRLSTTIRERKLTSFREYMDLLYQNKSGKELDNFLNRITTNYSFFGREQDHFSYLTQTVLPELVQRRNRDLRTWSAGCSTGQEPYHLAMAYRDFFGDSKGTWDTTILATDISHRVLEIAQKGVYPETDWNRLPPTWRHHYSVPVDAQNRQVSPEIRREVVFKSFNLMDKIVCRKPFDIIFCRNVMIYFDAQVTSELVERFYQATAPGGYLFIGHSENLSRANSKYESVGHAIYRKPLK